MKLQELFDYDLWANQKWLPVADAMNETHVMAHILMASQVWLGRCKRLEADLREDLNLDVRFQENTAAWKSFLDEADPNMPVFYSRSAGEEYTNTLDQIAQHVINHGTYHRGHLRGMAEERRVEFPETDLIKFVREREAALK